MPNVLLPSDSTKASFSQSEAAFFLCIFCTRHLLSLFSFSFLVASIFKNGRDSPKPAVGLPIPTSVRRCYLLSKEEGVSAVERRIQVVWGHLLLRLECETSNAGVRAKGLVKLPELELFE